MDGGDGIHRRHFEIGLTAVVEHLTDLGGEVGHDGGVEQGVESCEDHTSDDHADDDLHTGVDIALSQLVLNGSLNSGSTLLEFGYDFVDDFLHDFNSPVILLF